MFPSESPTGCTMPRSASCSLGWAETQTSIGVSVAAKPARAAAADAAADVGPSATAASRRLVVVASSVVGKLASAASATEIRSAPAISRAAATSGPAAPIFGPPSAEARLGVRWSASTDDMRHMWAPRGAPAENRAPPAETRCRSGVGFLKRESIPIDWKSDGAAACARNARWTSASDDPRRRPSGGVGVRPPKMPATAPNAPHFCDPGSTLSSMSEIVISSAERPRAILCMSAVRFWLRRQWRGRDRRSLHASAKARRRARMRWRPVYRRTSSRTAASTPRTTV